MGDLNFRYYLPTKTCEPVEYITEKIPRYVLFKSPLHHHPWPMIHAVKKLNTHIEFDLLQYEQLLDGDDFVKDLITIKLPILKYTITL